MANVKIILIVNTEKLLKKDKQKKKTKIDKYCYLVDNTQPALKTLPPHAPEKHETNIEPGQIIEWSGVAKDPGTCDCVSIDSISMEKKPKSRDLFGTPVLIGSGGVIHATILATDRPETQETYTLRFTVIRNKDGITRSFQIDPKLRINT